MRKNRQPTNQFSQMSSIKHQNSYNNQFDDNSFLKFSKTSNKPQEDLNAIQKLLTTLRKTQFNQKSTSQIINQNHYPITGMKSFNQKKYNTISKSNNSESNKKKQAISENKICVSTLNSIDTNFAIQSEPNYMKVSFSSYFQSCTYEDIQDNCSRISQQKRCACSKIFKFFEKFDHLKYIKKVCVQRLKFYSLSNYENYTKSLEKRQLHFLDLVLPPKQEQYKLKKYHQDLNILYVNKFIGLCQPSLILNQRQRIISRNIQKQKQKIRRIKQNSSQKKSAIKPQTQNQKSFVYNFQITPQYPFRASKKLQKDFEGTIFTRIS